MKRILLLAVSMTTAACSGGDLAGSPSGAAGGGVGGAPAGGSYAAGGTTAVGGTYSTGGIGPTGGTATGGSATGGRATGGTAGTTGTDPTCFACLSQYCAADWADCGAPGQIYPTKAGSTPVSEDLQTTCRQQNSRLIYRS